MWFVGWNELLIASFSHRSLSVSDAIILASGLHVTRDSAHQAGVGLIFDRVLTELVAKMREMNMDKSELACLKAIVLFNPGTLSTSIFSLLFQEQTIHIFPVWENLRYMLMNVTVK